MSRAQEIVDVVVNDAKWYARAQKYAKGKIPSVPIFICFAFLVSDVQERYRRKRWEVFTVEDMAQAIVLLHERFLEEE